MVEPGLGQNRRLALGRVTMNKYKHRTIILMVISILVFLGCGYAFVTTPVTHSNWTLGGCHGPYVSKGGTPRHYCEFTQGDKNKSVLQTRLAWESLKPQVGKEFTFEDPDAKDFWVFCMLISLVLIVLSSYVLWGKDE